MSTDLISKFSQNGEQFAFQANLSHKNVISLYPIDSQNDFKVPTSLITQIDYEQNDLNVKDILSVSWCLSSTNSIASMEQTPFSGSGDAVTTRSRKRKASLSDQSDDNRLEVNGSSSECYLVNSFPAGKIVIFSGNGKNNIVNIIQNKHDLLFLDTRDSFIWILDSDKTVKKFTYLQNKPLKTFHLSDGKNDQITNFEVHPLLDNQDYITILTDSNVFVIDPSKRRATTVAKFNLFGPLCTSIFKDGSKIIIADIEKISVFDISTKQLIKEWKIQSENVKIINDKFIIALTVYGKLVCMSLDDDEIVSTISVNESEIIDYTEMSNGLLLSWLNINEPKFEFVDLSKITQENEIVIDNGSIEDETETLIDNKSTKEKDEANDDSKNIVNEEESGVDKDKLIQVEQDELSKSLLSALDSESNETLISDLLLSNDWEELKIERFIVTKLSSDFQIQKLLNIISKSIKSNPRNKSSLPFIWLKLLLTLKDITTYSKNSKYSKHNTKTIRHVRSTLKSSSDSLSVLLALQGKLELLKSQASLRKSMLQLNLDDKQENNVSEGEEEEENMVYVNGEADTFFDASESKEYE